MSFFLGIVFADDSFFEYTLHSLMEIPKRIKLKTFPQQISTKSSKENKDKIEIKMGKSKYYITKSFVYIPISQKKLYQKL